MVIAAARLQGRVLRVHGPALHLVAQQARQDIERLEPARTFVAFVEKVEFERSRAGHAAAAVGRGGPVP